MVSCPWLPPARFKAPREWPPAWMASHEATGRSTQLNALLDPGGGGTGTSADALSPFVVRKHRLIFCATPKVASTSWLQLLRRMEDSPGLAAGRSRRWNEDPYFCSSEGGDGCRIGGLTQLKHLPSTPTRSKPSSERRWSGSR